MSYPGRLTVADSEGDGMVWVYLAALDVWRLVWLIDAQDLLDNGDAALDGPADAPLELIGRQRERWPPRRLRSA